MENRNVMITLTRMYLVTLFLLLFRAQICISQTLILANNVDLSISISVPQSTFSSSDSELQSRKMSFEILNRSNGDIKVLEPIRNITGFQGISGFYLNDACFSYKVEIYNPIKRYWNELDNNKIFNDINYVVPISKPEVQVIKSGEKYSQDIFLFKELQFPTKGKYRIQVFLGTKFRQDACIIYSSNMIEIELK